MGLMRFRAYPPDRLTEETAQQAYLSGPDRAPWPVRTTIEGGEIAIHRAASDSANLQIPWPVEGRGQVTLVTGSLVERPEPYRLPLELARGTIVQLRNQLSDWQTIGLAAPEAMMTKLAAAVDRFSWAVVEQDDAVTSSQYAEGALQAALEAGDLLVRAYADQAFAVRRHNGMKNDLALGADLGTTLLDHHSSRRFLATFNTAMVPMCWRDTEAAEGRFSWAISDAQIEWCRTNGRKVVAGPLLLLDPRALPDWLCLFESDFDSIAAFATSFARAAVLRYRGKVDYWICAGRVNSAEALSLDEQERLHLAARMIELIRSWDPTTPVLASFDQPWAEYLRYHPSDFPPLNFADALIRAGLDLEGIMLEINMGYGPGGTLVRPALEFNRHLDTWTKLGLPLWLSLSFPGGEGDDPLARRKTALPEGAGTAAAQQAFAARFVPLALAKPIVQGVIWNQLRDSQPHDFPHGGLFDAHNHMKPVLRTLSAIQQNYLK